MGDRLLINADLVRDLRIRKGWTASELATKCGFAPVTRTRIGKGGPVSIRTVRKLAAALGVEIPKILARSEATGSRATA
jgi:transcriptional regulator with XRE-family HTH domain